MIIALISFLAGAALTFAFAPFNLYGLSFLCPSALLYIWLRSTPRQAAYRGLLFGIGFFSTGIYWVFISIYHFGNAAIPLALFISFLVILLMALYPFAQGYLFRKFFQNKPLQIQCLIVFPATWALFELLRAIIWSGFPWISLGYSQLNTPLIGYGPIIGVYGVSLTTCFISGAFVLLVSQQKKLNIKITALSLIAAIMLGGWALKKISWTQPAGKAINVSLVQGNISHQLKWQPQETLNILNTYNNLTTSIPPKQVIIWPEAAVPVFPKNVKYYYAQWDKDAKDQQSYLIIGSPIYHRKQKKFYNGLTMIGLGKGQYLKHHLVPLGEYIPNIPGFKYIMRKLNIPMSDFSSGSIHQAPLKIGDYYAAASICFEIAFSRNILQQVNNTQFLINISDDSWFDSSIALYQQAEMAQFRAIETGRPIVLSTNTGMTAIINPAGKVIAQLPINTRAVLTGKITPMTGKTPLMRWNYYPMVGLIVLLLLISLLL
jgi:apolipoprotein N-acyltransferase